MLRYEDSLLDFAEDFWRDLDSDNPAFMAAGISYEMAFHPRETWNEVGAEIVDPRKLTRLGEITGLVLTDSLGCKAISVCQYRNSIDWLPPETAGRRSEFASEREKIRKYLQGWLPSRNGRGSFIVDGREDILQFISALAGYPTYFGYGDIYIFCDRLDVVVEIGHHAAFLFYSPNGRTVETFRHAAAGHGLTVTPAESAHP
jgi:hypothetical protein